MEMTGPRATPMGSWCRPSVCLGFRVYGLGHVRLLVGGVGFHTGGTRTRTQIREKEPHRQKDACPRSKSLDAFLGLTCILQQKRKRYETPNPLTLKRLPEVGSPRLNRNRPTKYRGNPYEPLVRGKVRLKLHYKIWGACACAYICAYICEYMP